MMTTPMLSIGIIFRDDIRCIENCLKCLQPLRDAIPCELVMADTGSTDGSREVAVRYADILFDFPWINDFAAARNAVMDRCSGTWYLTVDTDEYLQSDISELTAFLTTEAVQTGNSGSVVIRNHKTYELDGDYSDFMAIRIARLDEGIRYTGAVHESLGIPGGTLNVQAFTHTIFDHDGYVDLGNEKGAAKRARNVRLMRERIEEDPENVVLWLEMLDSSLFEPDYVELVHRAVSVLKSKGKNWETAGPAMLRNAIFVANDRNLPELDEWIEMAEEWFPDSIYTQIDVGFLKTMIAFREDNYEKCVELGETYLVAMERYHRGGSWADLMFGVPAQTGPVQEQRGKIALANACCNVGRLERAAELLTGLDYARIEPAHLAQMIGTLQELRYKSDMDTAQLVTELWEGVSAEKPSKEKADIRLNVFFQIAGLTFVPENREKEREKETFRRPSYTLYLPLRGKCEVGAAAAIMEENDPEKIEAILTEVDDWTRFPIHALAYALERGARFPLPDKPLNIEVMDALAGRLAADRERFLPIVKRAAHDGDRGNGQRLVWLRGLALAAVQSFPWSAEEAETEAGLSLARIFARAEKDFLPLCYAPETLTADRLFLLPPMHRFGWYCAQAFDALEAGDAAGYVRLLREGLSTCESVKDMVEFLVDHTPELNVPPEPSAELRALADQIRAVLANFSPDDPAVSALKQSEAYQKVAYLIEGIAPPIVGGLAQ